MRTKLRPRLTFANVMVTVLMFIVLGGGAYAAIGLSANSVRSKHIKDGQVKSPDIGEGQVRSGDLANAQVTPEKLGQVPAVRVFGPSDEGTPAGSGECPGVQDASAGVEVPLLFTAEDFDTANLHAGDYSQVADGACADAARSRLTAPLAGFYQVSAGVLWRVNNSPGHRASGDRSLGIRKNGGEYVVQQHGPVNDSPNSATLQNVSALVELDAGDYVEAFVYQAGETGLVRVDGLDKRSFASMVWVGSG